MAGLAPSLNVVQVVPNNVPNPTLLATNNTGAPVLLINNSASNIWVSSVASFTPGSSGAIPLPGFTSALWEPSGPVYGVIDNGQTAPAVVIVTNALSSWSPSPIGIQLSIPVINTVLFNSGGGAAPSDVALPFDSGILDVHTYQSLNITSFFKAATNFPDAASYNDLTINFYQDVNATQLVQTYTLLTTNWNIVGSGLNNEITLASVPVSGQYCVITYNKRFAAAGTGNLQIVGSSRSVNGFSAAQSPSAGQGQYLTFYQPGNGAVPFSWGGLYNPGSVRSLAINCGTGFFSTSIVDFFQYSFVNNVWQAVKMAHASGPANASTVLTSLNLLPGPFYINQNLGSSAGQISVLVT